MWSHDTALESIWWHHEREHLVSVKSKGCRIQVTSCEVDQQCLCPCYQSRCESYERSLALRRTLLHVQTCYIEGFESWVLQLYQWELSWEIQVDFFFFFLKELTFSEFRWIVTRNNLVVSKLRGYYICIIWWITGWTERDLPSSRIHDFREGRWFRTERSRHLDNET